MRFEGKTEEEAVALALKELKRPAAELSYKIIRDEKSFWGGRVVEIGVEVVGGGEPQAEGEPAAEAAEAAPSEAAVLDDEAWAAAEATLTEQLSAAGLLVQIRRRP